MQSKRVFFILFALLFCFTRKSYQVDGDYCFSDDVDRYQLFSSFTSYSIVRSSTRFQTAPSCTPIYIWGLIKHGTKFMSETEYETAKSQSAIKDQIEKNHEDKRDQLCDKDFQNLKNWQLLTLEKSQMDQITTQGMIEQGRIADDLKNLLNALFPSTNSKNSYDFYTSSTKLSQDSALAFTNKLFATTSQDIKENGITESNLLKQVYDESTSNTEEADSFIISDAHEKILEEISKRFGYERALSYDAVLSLYKICAYENAWMIENPALCAGFTHDHLKVFEYTQDLEHYYKFGYGNTKNERVRLPVMKDLLTKIKDAINEKADIKKGTFYFSHTPQVSSTMVSLGLYRDDEPLKQSNYETMKNSRKWKSSSIDAFSANIFAVVYKCPNNEGNKVGFYHNEELVKIPACRENFCKLDELENAYKDVFSYNDGTPDSPTGDKEPPKKPEEKKEEPPKNPEDKKEEPPKNPEDKKEDPSKKTEDKKEEPPKKPEDKKDDEKSSAIKIESIFFNLLVSSIIIFIRKL